MRVKELLIKFLRDNKWSEKQLLSEKWTNAHGNNRLECDALPNGIIHSVTLKSTGQDSCVYIGTQFDKGNIDLNLPHILVTTYAFYSR